MRAFSIKRGTSAYAVKDGREWYPQNIRKCETKEDQLFMLEEMIVDPTGIGKDFAYTERG